jgi:hypothetical protein
MQHSNDGTNRRAERLDASDRPSSRILTVSFILCVLIFALLAVYARWTVQHQVRVQNGEEELRATLEEVDRLDPGWRREDLKAKRRVIPDEENSALVVLAACQLMPKDWPTWRSLDRLAGREVSKQARWNYDRGIHSLPPTAQLNAQQLAILQAELSEADAALTEARKLSELSHGRLPPGEPKKSLIPTPSPPTNPHGGKPRQLAELLSFDVWVRTQRGDFGQALASCRALVNAGRAVGDEPEGMTAQLVRAACASRAGGQLERVLAQGSPPPADLFRMQQLLEDEAEAPILLTVARGERASVDLVMEGLSQQRYSAEELENMDKLEAAFRQASLTAAAEEEGKESAPNRIKWYAPERINFHRAWCLRFTTAFIEICKRPDWEQAEAIEQLKKTLEGQPDSLRQIGEILIHLSTSLHRHRANLSCAAVALAVERYRQVNGRWPDSLEALVPGQMKSLPLDPFNGRPLRYRREVQGVIVYSVGPDRKDDGGHFRWPHAMDLDRDIGFRLWDPQARRQPPTPVQPPDQLEKPEDADSQ